MKSLLRTTNPSSHTLGGHGLITDRSVPVHAAQVSPPQRADGHGVPKRQERLLLAAILLLAALLRLGWPGIVQFSLDEAQTMMLALSLAEGRGVPLFGTGTSFGLPTSPISEYVYVPAALLWDNPLWLTWFTAALNMIALVLFWRLSRRYWGPQVALCATLVFATHPWAIVSSRKIWEPNLIAFFAVPWAISGELAFHERQPRALVMHLALLSVIAQLHYSGLALLPVTAILLLVSWRHIDRRMLLAGLVAATILGLPFVYGVMQTQGEGWRASLNFVSGTARIDSESLRLWWITATGSDIHSLAGWPAYQDFLRLLPNLGGLRLALGILVGAGIGLWLLEGLRRRRGMTPANGVLMILWALAPILLLLRHVRPLYLHYFVVTIPALCLAAGLALGRAVAARRNALRIGAAILLIVLAGAQALTTVSILRFVGAQATPGGFGVPLQTQLRAADRARALGPPFVILADGDDPRLSSWVAVFEVLMHREPYRILDGSRLALFPSAPATLLITPGADAALQAYSEAGLLDLAEIVPNRRGEQPFRVLRLERGFMPELRGVPGPSRLAHGAEVTGYRVGGDLKPGQAFDWWIVWSSWRSASDPQTTYQIFNRLVDAQGGFVAQADGPTVRARDWAAGDLVVQRFRIELPAQVPSGPLWMRVGMYTYPEMQNQAVLDADGQAVGDFVALGPLASQ